jgi:hypothetical protein
LALGFSQWMAFGRMLKLLPPRIVVASTDFHIPRLPDHARSPDHPISFSYQCHQYESVVRFSPFFSAPSR